MNEIIQNLHSRKSIRVFTSQEISGASKEAILYAAMAAPTAGNQQLYTILDITDETLKQKLSVTCDNQPFIAQAKMALIFCADIQKWYDAFTEGGACPRAPGAGDLMLAVSDANIAAQNAVTAAWSLGIGSCYIGDIMEQCETHRELLHLPEYVFPAAMLVFGYPTEQQKNRTKPQRCRRMFEKECQTSGFEEWSRRFCQRKYNSDFAKEMSRSVDSYLRSFTR